MRLIALNQFYGAQATGQLLEDLTDSLSDSQP
jgi:hypothetical protein